MSDSGPHDLIRQELTESGDLIGAMLEDRTLIESTVEISTLVVETYRSGGKVMLFGNGGSAADSIHIAAEFVGRFLADRRPLPALSLAANLSSLTAIANDYGFDKVFARQVEALGQKGDVAIGLTTSGESANVVEAFKSAGKLGITTIALTGSDPRSAGAAADHVLAVPSSSTPHIQQAHMLVAHVICGWVESELTAGRI